MISAGTRKGSGHRSPYGGSGDDGGKLPPLSASPSPVLKVQNELVPSKINALSPLTKTVSSATTSTTSTTTVTSTITASFSRNLNDLTIDTSPSTTNFIGLTNMTSPPLSALSVPSEAQTPVTLETEDMSSDEEVDEDKSTSTIKFAIATLKNENMDFRKRECRKYFKTIFCYNAYKVSKEKRKENAMTVLEEGFVESIYLKFLKIIRDEKYYEEDVISEKEAVNNFKKALVIIWNTSDALADMCQRLVDTGVLYQHLEMLSSPFLAPELLKASKSKLYTVKGFLGINHNVCTRLDTRELLRAAGAVEILQIFLRSKFLMVKTKAVMTLSYLITEEENDKINASDQNIKFIISILKSAVESKTHKSKRYGFAVEEVLAGLNKIAANDSNKLTIVQGGALPYYVTCLDGWEEEQILAAQGLWIFAFSQENKALIREEPGCIEGLKKLTSSTNDSVRNAAKGALWVLEESETTTQVEKPSVDHENIKHVMISYQWDSQETMLWVKDRLKEAGYKVWMDVEQMEGSILEAMASAVENAAVVIVCMSQKYKDSPNCRTEAEYTFRLRKDIVPLMLQKDYRADGWLGAMSGNRKYFDFSHQDKWSRMMPDLCRELKNRGKLNPDRDDIDSRIVASTTTSAPSIVQEQSEIESWTLPQVQEWLTEIGLGDHKERFAEFDGPILRGLQRMCRTCPDFYYKTLKEDLKLGLVALLKFTNALERLT